MRCAVISDEVSQDLTRAVALAVRNGLEGIEVRSVWNTAPPDLSDGQLREVRKIVLDSGLEIAGYAPPLFKCTLPGTRTALRACRDAARRALEQAALLDAPIVRMFSFYRAGDPDALRAGEIAAEVLEHVDLAGGPALVLETGTRTNTPAVTYALQFLHAVDHPRIGLLWDPGNSAFSGFGADVFPGDYERARPFLRHVHVKNPKATCCYVPLDEGDLHWRSILRRLAADGYRDYVSLETHWRPGRTLTAQQRDEPWGEAFSDGGEQASGRCMSTLTAWVREALA